MTQKEEVITPPSNPHTRELDEDALLGKFIRGYEKLIWPLTLTWAVLLIISPVIANVMFRTVSWHYEDLFLALDRNYFWSDPTRFLFQGYDSQISESNTGFQLVGYAIVYTILLGVIFYAALRAVSAVAARKLRTQSTQLDRIQSLPMNDSLLYQAIQPHNSQEGISIKRRGKQFSIQLAGNSVWIVTSISDSNLHLYIDSLGSDFARRERKRLDLQPDQEIILDGTLLQQCRVYTPVSQHKTITKLLTPKIVSHILKYCEHMDLEIINGRIIAVTSVNDVTNSGRTKQVIENLATLVDILDEELPKHAFAKHGLIAKTRHVFRLPFITIYSKPIQYALLLSGALTIVLILLNNTGLTESEVMFIATLSTMLVTHIAYVRISRHRYAPDVRKNS